MAEMRILIIKLNPFLREGITNVVMNLYHAMDKQDMRMDMLGVYPVGDTYAQQIRSGGGQVFYLERTMRHPLRYIRELEQLIRSQGYDAIHVHGNSSTLALEMIAGWCAGCQVRIAHSHNTTSSYMTIHRLFKPVFRRLCTHRLACGVDAGKWLYGDKPFTVVNNGIDTSRFAFREEGRSEIRGQFGVTEQELLIGHVGRFNEAKNQGFLVELLQELTNRGLSYRLMLIGAGKLRETVEQKAETLGISHRVIFAGETDRVGDYLSACDLLVMPSLFEGLPLSLVEAQANGLHCVISENITREVDKTGNVNFLPLNGGPTLWADTVEALALPGDKKAASLEAIEKITACGYDIQTEAAKLKAYYRQAIDEANRA